LKKSLSELFGPAQGGFLLSLVKAAKKVMRKQSQDISYRFLIECFLDQFIVDNKIDQKVQRDPMLTLSSAMHGFPRYQHPLVEWLIDEPTMTHNYH
jgi:hypothetical protein